MAKFEKAIGTILKHEGGFVNHKSDPGGVTSYGISLRFLKDHPSDGDFDMDGDVDAEDIKNMTQRQAMEIYHKHWWAKYGYRNINDQTIATKVLDFSVNMGAKRAHILLQAALNNAFVLNLTEDGVLGPATIAVLNSIEDSEEQILLTAYCDEAWGFYQRLIANKPSLAVFKKGWYNRAYSLSKANSIS